MAVQGDVRLPEDTERMVGETIEGLGRLDILVNNAGFNRDTLLLRMSLDDWDEVMDVNLRAVFLCTKASLRPMMRQRWGRIINIGSVSGLAGNAGQANYAAAKSGLIGFTRAVAREMGSRSITSNLIAPGLVITELTKDIRQEIVDGVKQRLLIRQDGHAGRCSGVCRVSRLGRCVLRHRAGPVGRRRPGAVNDGQTQTSAHRGAAGAVRARQRRASTRGNHRATVRRLPGLT